MSFVIKRDSYFVLAITLVLVFSMFGCQTASNTRTDEASASSPQATQVEVANSEKSGTKKTAGEVTEASAEDKEKALQKFEKDLFDKWSGLLGHGGVTGRSTGEETVKADADEKVTLPSEEAETKSFPELEKKVIGKWLNEKETESMEFLADKTIRIINEQGSQRSIKGKFNFPQEDRLTVDFKGGLLKVPLMSFKIELSENELTLIGEADGVPTTYKRVSH
ncbi:MAG: hypothetical protein GY941_15695 [Planctomycetes bacterium]|nr:hypothetical protein [Planctomycetota bacterium]